jgi:hypothetical protein
VKKRRDFAKARKEKKRKRTNNIKKDSVNKWTLFQKKNMIHSLQYLELCRDVYTVIA